MAPVTFTAVVSAPKSLGAVTLLDPAASRPERAGENYPYLSVRSSRGETTDGGASRGRLSRRERERGDRGAASSRLPAPPEARARSFRCAYEHYAFAHPFPE